MRPVLVFDLDDTLYREHEFVQSGFRAVEDFLHGRQMDGEEFFQRVSALHVRGERGQLFDQVLAEFGVTDPVIIKQMVQVYREHVPSISLLEDAKWALEFFRPRKQLALITDGYWQTQHRKVEALGLTTVLDVVVYSDQLGPDKWKPSPAPYLEVMRQFDCAGVDCIYVGDNAVKDFVTAKRLGWFTVQVCREGGEFAGRTVETSHEADVRVTSLYELQHVKELCESDGCAPRFGA